MIIDALDEAASPAQARAIIDQVVLPLAETCSDAGAQVVVGTRRRDDGGDLLDRFGGALESIDLDDPRYFAEDDLAAYALACLQLAGDERPGNPYLDDTLAVPVASAIAAMAGPELPDRRPDRPLPRPARRGSRRPGRLAFSATVDSALAAYLERLSPVAGMPADRALTALAFAEAPGLPAALWQLAIEAIDGTHGQRRGPDPVRPLVGGQLPGGNGRRGRHRGSRSYRLFHQALNDALLRRRSEVMPRADDERALTLAFTRHGRRSRWKDAPEYLLRSLPAHAAAAGLVDDLLGDDAYLLHADLRRLIQVADGADSEQGRRRAQLLRLTPRAITAGPADRAALFSVTEALDDLGASYRDGGWQAPYRALWASVKPRSERAVLEGHQGWVNGVCPVTVAGKQLLASAGNDGTVRIWDPETGQQRTVLEGHQGWVNGVCPVTVAGRSCWPAPATTARCGSGTPRPASSAPRWKATRTACGRCARSPWPGRSCWPAPATTARCGSGTPRPASSAPPWRATGTASTSSARSRSPDGAAGQRQRRRHRPDLGPRDRPAARDPGRPPA